MGKVTIDSKTVDYLVYYHYSEFVSSLVYANDYELIFIVLNRMHPGAEIMKDLMKLCMKYGHMDLLDKLDDLYIELGYENRSICSIM